MRRAAAYLRVSSDHQANEDRFGYERQITEIIRYAERAGFELTREYRDAITGKSTTRRALSELQRDASRYEAVIISSVDRLGRHVSATDRVLAALIASGLEVHSAEFGLIDLEDDTSLVQFNIRSLVAHLERQKIVKRTQAARIAIAQAGGIPNGVKGLGFRTQKRKLVIIPDEAEVVRAVFEASAAGESMSGIAARLTADGVPRWSSERPWRFTDVQRVLTNPLYRGEYVWGGISIPVPAIVSPGLWSRAQPRGRGRRPRTNLALLGHIRCGWCGHRLSTRWEYDRKRRPRWPVYRCQGGKLPDVRCKFGQISARRLEPVVERAVRDALANEATIRELLAIAEDDAPATADARAELEREDAQWLEAFRHGAITAAELASYRADVRRRVAALAQDTGRAEVEVERLVRAARELPLPELLDLARVLVVVRSRDDVLVTINAEGV